jgi:hypothetical protein
VIPQDDPQTAVRGTRARRASRRRFLRVTAVVAAVVVVTGGIWVVTRDGTAPPPQASGPAPASGKGATPTFLTLSITGGAIPHLAVVGSGPEAAAIPIPADLSIVVPGQGETPVTEIATLPGPSVQVALSNEVGVWTEDWVVMNLDGFARMVDRSGGLTVDLSEPVVTSAGVLGPGEVKLKGIQAGALMRAKGADPAARWDLMLSALLADPPSLQPSDMVGSSPLPSVQATLDAATGAQILPMPVQVVGAAAVSQQPALDELMTSTWGTTPPTPAIVQNGNGAPGVGESVARAIIPAGFRVTLSQNAQTFDQATTEVIANGNEYLGAARRAWKALGVGQVQASQVPSGIGDITIVVGKDFTA